VTTKKETTLLEYYQEHELNPVPIDVEDHLGWKDHVIKRRNLYEKHLMLPTACFRDRSVIEFGCNSGENALYLAALGARLTLVEPNGQVLPRLRDLFERFGLDSRIEALVNTDIAGFEANQQYDVMLAEGFLSALAERDQAALKLCSLVKPGGLGVISFDDRYGSLMELLRQMIFGGLGNWPRLRIRTVSNRWSWRADYLRRILVGLTRRGRSQPGGRTCWSVRLFRGRDCGVTMRCWRCWSRRIANFTVPRRGGFRWIIFAGIKMLPSAAIVMNGFWNSGTVVSLIS